MRVLKSLCIAFFVLSLILAIEGGIQSTGIARVYPFIWPVTFAGAFYGIYRRAPIAWRLGWIVLAMWSLAILISGISTAWRLAPPGCWIVSVAILIGCLAFALLWGRWWERQKSYFIPSNGPAEPRTCVSRHLLGWSIVLGLIGILVLVSGRFVLQKSDRIWIITQQNHPIIFYGVDAIILLSSVTMLTYAFYRTRHS